MNIIDIKKQQYRKELFVRARTIPNSYSSDIFKIVLTLCGREKVLINNPNAGFFFIKLDETVEDNWNKYSTDGVFSSSDSCPIIKYEVCSSQYCSTSADSSAIRMSPNNEVEVNSGKKIAQAKYYLKLTTEGD